MTPCNEKDGMKQRKVSAGRPSWLSILRSILYICILTFYPDSTPPNRGTQRKSQHAENGGVALSLCTTPSLTFSSQATGLLMQLQTQASLMPQSPLGRSCSLAHPKCSEREEQKRRKKTSDALHLAVVPLSHTC